MATKVTPKTAPKPASKVDSKAKEIAARSKLILGLVPEISALATTIGEHRAGLESSRKDLVLQMIALRKEHTLTPDEVTTLLRLAYAEAGGYDVSLLEKDGMKNKPSDYGDVSKLKGMIVHKCKPAETDKMVARIEKGEEFAFEKMREMLVDPNGRAASLTQKRKPGPTAGAGNRKPKDSAPTVKFESVEDLYDLVKKAIRDAMAEGYEAETIQERLSELLAELEAGELETEEETAEEEAEETPKKKAKK